ncbi:MAG: hypothetical protein EHM28_01555 [Spirochaetaceae bacterium]|nr:MAG: hypothetical protein EHM28_01555 [Spirochaetaceae bacterium]
MKKLFYICMILLCGLSAFAQETAAAASSVTAEAQKDAEFLTFDLNIAPNTTGALEGKAALGLLWSPWVCSGVTFSVSSFTTVYDNETGGGSTTSVESTKNLDVDVLRTNPDFLKWYFAGDDFYIAANARIFLNIKWINQEKYGYFDTPTFVMYYTQEDLFNLYPFGGADLEVKLGPVLFTGYFIQSVMVLYTTIEGKYYDTALLDTPTKYSLEDEGFETRAGGTATFFPIPEITIKYGFDFVSHIGYTYGYSGGAVSKVVYTGIEMKHTLTASVNINGYEPLIGASCTTYSFEPLKSIYSALSYSTDRWGFIFGVKYK